MPTWKYEDAGESSPLCELLELSHVVSRHLNFVLFNVQLLFAFCHHGIMWYWRKKLVETYLLIVNKNNSVWKLQRLVRIEKYVYSILFTVSMFGYIDLIELWFTFVQTIIRTITKTCFKNYKVRNVFYYLSIEEHPQSSQTVLLTDLYSKQSIVAWCL